MEILAGIITIILLIFLLKLLSISIKIITKLALNGVLGLIILIIFNFFGESLFGIKIDISILNSIIVGILGIPGIIILLLFGN